MMRGQNGQSCVLSLKIFPVACPVKQESGLKRLKEMVYDKN